METLFAYGISFGDMIIHGVDSYPHSEGHFAIKAYSVIKNVVYRTHMLYLYHKVDMHHIGFKHKITDAMETMRQIDRGDLCSAIMVYARGTENERYDVTHLSNYKMLGTFGEHDVPVTDPSIPIPDSQVAGLYVNINCTSKQKIFPVFCFKGSLEQVYGESLKMYDLLSGS
jgi:hypothetical protein